MEGILGEQIPAARQYPYRRHEHGDRGIDYAAAEQEQVRIPDDCRNDRFRTARNRCGASLFSSASPLIQTLIAFLFALAGTMLFMKILDGIKLKDAILIPLVGIMLGNVIGSITTFFAYQYDLIQSIGSWLQGDFSMILKGDYELLYLSIPLVILAYLFAHRFTIAGMGEDFSKNLGMNHKQVVYIGLFIVALMTSVVVLTVGSIPFLGLIVPNIVSIYRGTT